MLPHENECPFHPGMFHHNPGCRWGGLPWDVVRGWVLELLGWPAPGWQDGGELSWPGLSGQAARVRSCWCRDGLGSSEQPPWGL